MASTQSDLSAYEKKRLENIQRNAAFLAQLGFDPIAKKEREVKVESEMKYYKKPTQKTKRKLDEVAPTRYSQRLRSMEAEEAARAEVKETESEEIAQDESDGIDYELMPESSEELDDHEFQVYVFLRAWRLKTSRELDIEPYKVCQNRTLAELVRRRRNDAHWARRHGRVAGDLLECWGIGPSKARPDGFGAQMIELLDASEEMEAHLRASREGLPTAPTESPTHDDSKAEDKSKSEK